MRSTGSTPMTAATANANLTTSSTATRVPVVGDVVLDHDLQSEHRVPGGESTSSTASAAVTGESSQPTMARVARAIEGPSDEDEPDPEQHERHGGDACPTQWAEPPLAEPSPSTAPNGLRRLMRHPRGSLFRIRPWPRASTTAPIARPSRSARGGEFEAVAVSKTR